MGDQQQRNPNLYAVLILTWPNLISLARLFSVPVIVWMILTDRMFAAFITTCLAGISDMFDGLVARLLKTPSRLGAFLDPIADKVMLVTLYVTMGMTGYMPIWLVILIVFRDFMILGGTLLLFLLDKDLIAKPLMISKVNTFLQIVTLAWLLAELGLNFTVPAVLPVLYITIAATTILSGGAYVLLWLKHIAAGGPELDEH
ncbi:MAG: CDP-alcohol phosphatidyltransferase family protein [Alphaproteobacteria bacterium]